MDIRDQVALVTGGASGLGLASARRLAAEGARVIVADLDEDAGRTAANEVDGRFARLDVTQPAAWAQLVAGIEAELGGIDVAFLNAGVATGERNVVDVTDEQYRRILGVNVDGVFFGLRAVAPGMTRRERGAIVATASLGGLVPMAMDPVYSATKHAVVALCRSAAPQLAPVTVNALCPGFADTPLVTEDERAMIREWGVPLISPDDVAAALVEIVAGDGTGEAWFVQPGHAGVFRFGGVPGPRV